MSFFTNLRRVNKVYPNSVDFVADNARLLTTTPAGFTNVLRAPSVRNIGNNRYVPGYNLSNNRFVSTADINRITRNNDVPNIRNTFTGISDNQIGSLRQLRRADNVPDVNYHTRRTRSNAIKQNFPETSVRTPDGVDRALQQNPRLHSRMIDMKRVGVGVALAGGGYLLFSAATLVQDIINVLNNTGGSYYVRGKDGGDNVDACLLLQRTCRQDPNLNRSEVTICEFDPLLPNDVASLQNICNGFNYETEKTVCRASDPSADPTTPQYVDISDLPPGQTLMCIEPYDFGDLIGDLNLDWLLGDEGLVNKSSNLSDSVSGKLMPIILLIAGIFVIGLIIYLIYRFIIKRSGGGGSGVGGGGNYGGGSNRPIIITLQNPTPSQQTTTQ
ncbi:ORF_10 [Catopsilia pomona nucleopolyhedrovirus]|uniref:ORF_10 n=1 Tax=Catopsilia pomona nucleopolyhedrovirus TaxID=1850906 RepID=A0A172WZ80_9ABAC|nr:ORF_10 [Catopsilia pomona nucleopolyhedrovirus]ANF29658.1 ORF_10 [Catopsilia pomona nucleopolyhedrovirus]